MFMKHLSLTYKCHSSIGNSLNLNEMLKEVLETFVDDTNASSGYFYLVDNDNKLHRYLSYKEDINFHEEDYYKKDIKIFTVVDSVDNKSRVLIIPLEKGFLFIVYNKREEVDLDIIGSMFQDMVVKLNISIDSCLNVQKMKNKNDMLKQLTSELKQQQQELIEADKYKSNFLANMSHELKTPLNSIIVISSIMKKNKNDKLDESQVKNMNVINSCGNDLLYLINDVLDISKIEAGEISLNLAKTNLNLLIDELVNEMEPIANQKKLTLKFSCLLDNVNLLSDSHRIKQILKNLLSNAIKFTDSGIIDVVLEKNANDITIKVIDRGIGIAEEKLKHIFDRFKQADGSTTRKYGGTGLGLAISKELSFLLGGDIKAFSKLGEGSTFELILPKKTDIKNISDDNVSISSKSDEVQIEDIVLFDMEDVDISDESYIKEYKVILLNCDNITMLPVVVGLRKNDVILKRLDSLNDTFEILEKEEFDLIVIDKENTLTQIDKFINYCQEKNTQTIVLSKEDTNVTNFFDKKDIKAKLVDEILEKIGK
ncbi:hypothetical protein LPB137_08280 [Poseidonibacter parvus]|uniref:histidine kinase n=1 Tax=Poseidonibacter parvus TaxID=1850254 RepID=A0A1P8KMQ7_9BACT|nr:HAMP domain-containing sensor histidine kinase [Poseidonibacter parvus]APW65854.1 hypothetical protein LPB137_08280 [Poseidonibacter parvus]